MDLTLKQYESIRPRCEIEHQGVRMAFETPSRMTRWRVDSIYRKEPCTLDWIASFSEGETLLDCGANVGMYTVWAAATRRARVIALEPEAQNFSLLNKNILLNKLSDRVRAYCLGLADVTGLSTLHIANLKLGGSCHAVGEALDFRLQPLQAVFEQGCLAFRLDDLVRSGAVPVPDHIKIDVDGFEYKVIGGARETLRNGKVRSLLIEINPELAPHQGMLAELNELGFSYDPAQVALAQRTQGRFKGVAEHVFRR